jgi:hypothetical protein
MQLVVPTNGLEHPRMGFSMGFSATWGFSGPFFPEKLKEITS